jgi:serralysin
VKVGTITASATGAGNSEVDITLRGSGDVGAITLTFGASHSGYAGYIDLQMDTVDSDVGLIKVTGGSDTSSFEISGGPGVSANTVAGVDMSLFNGSAYINLDGVSGGTSIKAGKAGSTIIGTDGNDTILGGAGVDVITGGTGDDKMTGGLGNDVFMFTSNAVWNVNDSITDLGTAALNSTPLSDAAITGLDGDILEFSLADLAAMTGYAGNDLTTTAPTGSNGSTLAAADFTAGPGGVAGVAHAQFVQDTTSGILYFDADGTGGQAMVAIATVGTAALTTTSFLLVA